MNDPIPTEKINPPTEFELACVQMLITFATRCEGDPERLAAVAKANVVVAEASRSLIMRSQILGKRWDTWTQSELLELVRTADANDVPPGERSYKSAESV